MSTIQNDHVDILNDVSREEFKVFSVSKVISATDSVFREMYQEMNVDKNLMFRQCHFNKREASGGVSKEKLSEWLETVCYILDFSLPLLNNAVKKIDRQTERIDELQKGKIDDQQTIIKLHEGISKKIGDELKEVKSTVQSTVQSEMQSYAAIAKKNCHKTLTSKTIEAAVKRVCDQEDRSKNVIVYGIEETRDEVLQDSVEKILGEIDEKPLVRDCVRVGVKKTGATQARPVKFSLSNSDHVAQVLRSARRLRTIEGYKSVYICPDRTVQERKSYKTLLVKLKERRESEPNRTHYIRNNRIVSSDVICDSSRGDNGKR